MQGPRIGFVLILILCSFEISAQTPTATINGRILDPTRAAIPGATVDAVNTSTNIRHTTQTNAEGLFTLVDLAPGDYRIEIAKSGFRTIVKPGVVLHVQDVVALNFDMSVGSTSETVTVEGGASLINTESASVGTVVDRQFADNLPMNGRSFQSLLELTPGVVVLPTNVQDQGQFAVNGQRATSNYWSVDGVSANIGIGVAGVGANGNGMAGSLGGFSAQGGTNSLVSIDAMQEFRIQTSTYAPEFGRSPGAQIAIATRSGANRVHATVFDYLRNDALDANNWFNTFVAPAVPKPKERQNDFGGTLGGPIIRDRTFFFFSYEGLRLRLPQTVISSVPDLSARQTAPSSVQPFLKAFPLPTGADNPATGIAQFNASFSSTSTLDATSLRLDHRLNNQINLFARYNYSPSEIIQRGGGVIAPSVVTPIKIAIQTSTLGATWTPSPNIANDLRFNYSRTNASSHSFVDDFGGATPLVSLPFPSPFAADNAQLSYLILSLGSSSRQIKDGLNLSNTQHQLNLVDTVTVQRGSHALKFGVDFRRLSPVSIPEQYFQSVSFASVAAATTGVAPRVGVQSLAPAYLLFRNLGAFAQDTWHVTPLFTLTYGLRWDVDFAPSTLQAPNIPAVTGYNLSDLSTLAVAPLGRSPFATPYGNVAPRIGMAYQVHQNPNWQTVVRGGFGVFYDLASAQTGGLVNVFPPFAMNRTLLNTTFPLSAANSTPPAIPSTAMLSNILALNPKLNLPYTLQWNVATEQGLGRQQSLSLSYIGAAGRRLLQVTTLAAPTTNPAVGFGQFVDNTATSDYDALQIQFQRQLSRSLQALSSYTWSHSLDTGSASSSQVGSNEGVPGTSSNRGPSDFDIRHAFTLGTTYIVPMPSQMPLLKAVLYGWSLDNDVEARSAPPVDVSTSFFELPNRVFSDIRPDLVPGQPLYLYGQRYPGGKAFNPAAFVNPPSSGGFPVRQGNVSRNFLRGFGAVQWDLAVHRDFGIRETLKLQFRAELFNVLNHPNFGQPSGSLGGNFGLANQTLNQSLAGSGTTGAGSFSPLYQIGGPRSVQFALKLSF